GTKTLEQRFEGLVRSRQVGLEGSIGHGRPYTPPRGITPLREHRTVKSFFKLHRGLNARPASACGDRRRRGADLRVVFRMESHQSFAAARPARACLWLAGGFCDYDSRMAA